VKEASVLTVVDTSKRHVPVFDPKHRCCGEHKSLERSVSPRHSPLPDDG